jgi:hypothetical protein
VDVLTDAYRTYRAFMHHRSLERAEPLADANDFVASRKAVTRLWHDTFDASHASPPL